MNDLTPSRTSAGPAPLVRSIRIAVLAMGGEGGGVLANWLVELARANAHVAQMTSVPGVAQRTGATIYYIEMFPKARMGPDQHPVLALMPVPGDVDIVLASELMEAGRAIQRGFVTPDRTNLIASSHRVYSITERMAMSDGRVDEEALLTACRSAAQRFIAFDMMRMAEHSGSMLSAVMFGALAGAGLLPFDRAAFEATIREGGVGVKASLNAFASGFDAGSGQLIQPAQDPAETGEPNSQAAPLSLHEEIARRFPASVVEIVKTGTDHCLDWQDGAYARLYLDRLAPFLAPDKGYEDPDWQVLGEVARQLALAMTYEDTIRVADLKIRKSRFERVAAEAGIKDGQLLEIREYLHPRLQEIVETVPAGLGRLIMSQGWLARLIARWTEEGKTVETTSISGFVMLYAVASMRPWRRSNLRYAHEQQSIEAWLGVVRQTARRNGALAREVAELRGLIKGYGDTHARGTDNYTRIMTRLPILQGHEASTTLAQWRQAANADETGQALSVLLAQTEAKQDRA